MATESPFAIPPRGNDVPGLSHFSVDVPDAELERLNRLIDDTVLAKPTHVNETTDEDNGVTRAWTEDMLRKWRREFSWRDFEAKINAIPNFKMRLTLLDQEVDVHFAALFSPNPSAIPVLLIHGWPGSFVEFLPLLHLVQARFAYSPSTLPYHLVVPSIPGFAFSDLPRRGALSVPDAGVLYNTLMCNLGFGASAAGGGYVVQGGDVGSVFVNAMTPMFPDVIAGLSNMLQVSPPPDADPAETAAAVAAGTALLQRGFAYATLQQTRPSTAGLAVGSSPVALLAWIGEKMVEWTDLALPEEYVLGNVSLYWLTGCYPTSLWPYRHIDEVMARRTGAQATLGKPFGYLRFPREMGVTPPAWAEKEAKITWFRDHERGGHFAALEQPAVFLAGLEAFLGHVREKRG